MVCREVFVYSVFLLGACIHSYNFVIVICRVRVWSDNLSVTSWLAST